jgi:hypothetical protein
MVNDKVCRWHWKIYATVVMLVFVMAYVRRFFRMISVAIRWSAYNERMSIGQDIKEYRRAHGLSQAEFASLVGSGQGAVTRWELGQRQPRGAGTRE